MISRDGEIYMYCKNCGKELADDAIICPECGSPTKNSPTGKEKNKVIAGLLALFLGTLGLHNFYLGYTTKGVVQLLLTILGSCILVGPIITCIWAFIEGIMIFAGKIKDSEGKELV